MKKLLLLAILLVAIGAGLWLVSLRWPYYKGTPDFAKLSQQLEAFPEDDRIGKWNAQLKQIETPRKAYADWGFGVAGLGAGLAAIVGAGGIYRRVPEAGRKALFFVLWTGSWLSVIPGGIIYYVIRCKRFDYPMGADAIAIPIYEISVGALICCGITTVILVFLLMGRELPERLGFIRPTTLAGWGRFILLSVWVVLLLACLPSEIPDGGLEDILMLVWTSTLLLLVLSAPKKHSALV